MDLLDLFRENSTLTPEYLLALITYLPVESAFQAEKRGGQQFRGWNPQMYAIVAAVNALRSLQHMYVLTHLGKKASKPKPPEPFPIPQKKKEEQTSYRPGSFGAMVGSMMAASRRRKAGG
ncbi:Uncharacterised protein [Mycobacteroides abscessus subsp. abscessus]|uniref:D site-binding protein n=1 Tax=Mycobacteroides abscessus TaxID=36809 RepID=UPI000928E59C|nr:D site-binding protein [Mycobacteroides abscessus]SHS97920.1 Uncharacterised protein [Mycobacteroides abscessus subsp. abscessus]